MINYYFKMFYKTTCYKTKSNISQFFCFLFFSHGLLHECFFSFLIKALISFEKLPPPLPFNYQDLLVKSKRLMSTVQIRLFFIRDSFYHSTIFWNQFDFDSRNRFQFFIIIIVFENLSDTLFQFHYSSSKASNNYWNYFDGIIVSSFRNLKHYRWYFPFFSCRLAILLYAFGYAVSINSINFLHVSSIVQSGLRATHSVLIPSPRRFFSIFFNHFSTSPVCCIPLCIFREQFVFYSFTAHFTANIFKVLFCCLTYFVPTSYLHPDKKWYTISLSPPAP